MGQVHKYADSKLVDRRVRSESEPLHVPDHPVHLSSARRFGGKQQSSLVEHSSGDWSWKPLLSRHSHPRFRPTSHHRACKRCGLTACLSLIAHTEACA